MTETRREDVLSAIGVMTAIATDPDETNRLAAQLVNEWAAENPDGTNRVVLGLVELCTMLLTQLHVRTGEPFVTPLQVAATILHDDD